MNKLQAFHSFWNGFNLTAYDETSVPDNAEMPYITYEVINDNFGNTMAMNVSLWYRSSSWIDITAKEFEISNEISRGGKLIKYDNGAFWIRKGTPWAQRMLDESDDYIRRIILAIEIEFLD